MSIAKDIIQGWNQRQTKTVLHEKMIKNFGKIHSNNDPETHHKNMLDLLKEFIDSLPSSQSDYFDSNSCFEGFLNWNASWKKIYSRYSHKLPIEIVHTAYESWCIETKGNHTEFKELWENCMIRSFSEAVCETVGSVMNQHSGKNRHLQPHYFSIEMYLRWNLGPLHFLKKLIEDVYNREKKLYIRKTTRIDMIVTKDLSKSAAVSSFHKRAEEKSNLPASFWI